MQWFSWITFLYGLKCLWFPSARLTCEMCELLGTEIVNTSGYHPQRIHGVVEMFNNNSTIISMLSKCVEKHSRDWDRQLESL